MKKLFTDEQIIGLLREADAGVAEVAAIGRPLGIPLIVAKIATEAVLFANPLALAACAADSVRRLTTCGAASSAAWRCPWSCA